MGEVPNADFSRRAAGRGHGQAAPIIREGKSVAVAGDANGLAPGIYDIYVDSSRDGLSMIFNSEAGELGTVDLYLLGVAQIRIVPEPTTLTLIGLVALGLVRRPRRLQFCA